MGKRRFWDAFFSFFFCSCTAVWKNSFVARFLNKVISMGQNSKEKAIPKHRPAKNPASQKAKQSPTKNQYNFQNNNPKKGRRALARRPVFGRRVCALRCCFEICIDLLWAFAWLFGWLDSFLACALGWYFP